LQAYFYQDDSSGRVALSNKRFSCVQPSTVFVFRPSINSLLAE
jgi:hypothetical protein